MNPKSGSKKQEKFLDSSLKLGEFEIGNDKFTRFHIINLLEKDKKEAALKEMSQIRKSKQG